MNTESQPALFSSLHRIHMIGIGGIVMGGLAELFHHWGKVVTGVERAPNARTQKLAAHGIHCGIGDARARISPHTDCVVVSPRAPSGHPDLQEARVWGLPIYSVAEILGMLSRFHKIIAVAGCHGKTTVGAYLGTALEKAHRDPSALLRAPVEVWGSNVRCGRGEHLVVEADENEERFLSLTPAIGIITNIEVDHLDYYKNLDNILSAYRAFAKNVCRYGALIANHDDANVVKALKGMRGEIVWFGAKEGSEVRALDVRTSQTPLSFLLHIKRGEQDIQFNLAVSGEYQITNALAVAATCYQLGIPLQTAQEVLSAYRGSVRHMELIGERDGIAVIDDAADHPSEISAVLHALRKEYHGRRICCIFQPYSHIRTKYLAEDIARAFTDADSVWIAPIMPSAGETSKEYTTLQLIASASQYHTDIMEFKSLKTMLLTSLSRSDNPVIVTLGADMVREIGKEALNMNAPQTPATTRR